MPERSGSSATDKECSDGAHRQLWNWTTERTSNENCNFHTFISYDVTLMTHDTKRKAIKVYEKNAKSLPISLRWFGARREKEKNQLPRVPRRLNYFRSVPPLGRWMQIRSILVFRFFLFLNSNRCFGYSRGTSVHRKWFHCVRKTIWRFICLYFSSCHLFLFFFLWKYWNKKRNGVLHFRWQRMRKQSFSCFCRPFMLFYTPRKLHRPKKK